MPQKKGVAKQPVVAQKATKTSSSDDDTKLFAFLAIFLGIIGFIIALVAKKENKYVMYYAKQSLVLFITTIILYVGAMILTFLTLGLGAFIIIPIVWLIIVILWIIGIINSLSGEEKPLPVIGGFGEKFNF